MTSPSTSCATRWLIALSLWIPAAYANYAFGYNQASRLDALHAIVDGDGLVIDRYHTNTDDKALYDGHYYCDKAPGTLVLALPAFTAGRVALAVAGVEPGTLRHWKLSSWIATAGSVAVLMALGGLAFHRLLLDHVSPRAALACTWAVFLGTPALPYSAMLFSHGSTIGLLAIALCAAFARAPLFPDATGRERWPWRDLAVGLAGGVALTGEYPALPAALAFIALYAGRFGWRRAPIAAVAFVTCFAALLAYQAIVFGSPWIVTYQYSQWVPPVEPPAQWEPTSEITLGRLVALLFLPMRGLFFWSPFLLLAAVGVRPAWRASWLLPPCAAALLVVNVGYILLSRAAPWGGDAMGARHLSVLVPILGLLAGMGAARLPRLGVVLGGASVLLHVIGTLAGPMPSVRYTNPLVQVHLPALATGELPLNAGRLLGLQGLWSLAPLAVLWVPLALAVWRPLTARGRPAV